MHQQNQIKRTLALPDSIEVVRALLNAEAYKNRASVSKAVCQHFNFSDAPVAHKSGVASRHCANWSA